MRISDWSSDVCSSDLGAEPATDELIGTVHAQHLIDAVRRLGEDPSGTDLEHGLGSEDTPVFAGMHEAGARVVGASVEAARRVWTGQDLHSVNIMGGLHHALAGRASGFGVYNRSEARRGGKEGVSRCRYG